MSFKHNAISLPSIIYEQIIGGSKRSSTNGSLAKVPVNIEVAT